MNKGQELYQELISKVWADENFKKEFMANPRKTLEEFGVFIDKDKEIVVEDQTNDSVVYFNIPAEPNLDELELTEEELEMVSGGSTWTIGFSIVALFTAGYRHGKADAEASN